MRQSRKGALQSGWGSDPADGSSSGSSSEPVVHLHDLGLDGADRWPVPKPRVGGSLSAPALEPEANGLLLACLDSS
jgi:hypothetical protein